MDPTCGITRDPPTLLTLPVEVQSIIFTYAYAPDHEVKIKATKPRGLSMRRGRALQPLPEPTILDFMVSKIFFTGATAAYVKHSTLNVYSHTILEVAEPMATLKIGLAGLFMTLSKFPPTPPLKHLTIFVTDDDLKFGGHEKEPCMDVYENADFLRNDMIEQLTKLRGLKHFCAVADRSYDDETGDERAIFESNVFQLEQFVKLFVLQAESPVATIDELQPMHMPLYRGSRVCSVGCSSLLDYPPSSRTVLPPQDPPGDERSLTDAEIPNTKQELWSLMATSAGRILARLQETKQRRQET